MELRKLSKEEHEKTRRLWESVFPEDTREFLDYYYFIKAQDNTIYVLEEDQAIRSMIQLNPYLLQVEDTQHMCHYIIAVSTEEPYRGRGYMRRLLLKSMEDMYAKKEPFTFLMPASEAIYTPYDFRFVYWQRQADLCGAAPERDGGDPYIGRDARLADGELMARFFKACTKGKYQVYAVHTPHYYQTMILEQQSENGGVRLVYQKEELIGMFAYAYEGEWEIREPLFLEGKEKALFPALYELMWNETTQVKCRAFELQIPAEQVQGLVKKPMIMARILHLETLLKSMKVRSGERICCSFAVLDSLLPGNSKVWKLENEEGSEIVNVRETEDSQGVITIEALTEFLFGVKSAEETAKEPHVVLSDELMRELEKLKPLQHIFLNEIV